MGRYKSVMGQAATGFGKTVDSSAIAQSAQSKGKRVIFAVQSASDQPNPKRYTFRCWGVVYAARHGPRSS